MFRGRTTFLFTIAALIFAAGMSRTGRAQPARTDAVPDADQEPWTEALRRAGVIGSLGPATGTCAGPPGAPQPAACRVNLDADIEDAVFLPRVFNIESTYGQSLCVRRMLCKAFDRAVKGKRKRRPKAPMYLVRMHYELMMTMVALAKEFYDSVDNERERGYATVGQYTGVYRHLLAKNYSDDWARHLAAVVYIYKLGVDTPVLKHLYQGGSVSMEVNAYPYDHKSDRVLFRFAPLALYKERFSKPILKAGRTRWALEAAWTIEGMWHMGPVVLTASGAACPRYDLTFAMRLETEVSLRVRIPVQGLGPLWISEVTLMPRFLYMYSTNPVVMDVFGPEDLALLESAGFLKLANYKQNLSAYIHVVFQLSK